MAKANKDKDTAKASPKLESQPWIPMKTGLIVITITSLVMAVLTGIQVIPAKGWLEGIMWSVIFGALIWIIFFGLIFINRLLRR